MLITEPGHVTVQDGRFLTAAAPTQRDTSPGSADRKDEQDRPAAARKILLVEDNFDVLHSTVKLLRQIGHHVDYAINGYAALELARRFRPEVVFLDLGLPGMDGFELCRRLKKEPGLENVRVIALTGYGHDDYRERSKAAGCEMHLLKPVSPEVLEEILRK
jgi:CheY-like chemotaxis protein